MHAFGGWETYQKIEISHSYERRYDVSFERILLDIENILVLNIKHGNEFEY